MPVRRSGSIIFLAVDMPRGPHETPAHRAPSYWTQGHIPPMYFGVIDLIAEEIDSTKSEGFIGLFCFMDELGDHFRETYGG
jgi:hypothetical protein